MSQNVSDLITQVRAQLDEANAETVTDTQILQALNRGQRKAANIASRKFDSLFVVPDETTITVAGQRDYAIPAAAYGRRIELVEVVETSEIAWQIHRIKLQQTSQFNTSSQVTRPYYYALQKNKFLLYPVPSDGRMIRIWYTQTPEDLVVPQGRITSINTGSNYVVVDEIGSDISTVVTGFASYANIVDFTTGEVKATLQVSALDPDTGQITFKSAGLTRSTVLNKTVGTSIPSDVATDDYVCLVTGTAVPELPGAYVDYLIQYGVVETRRRLGEDTQEEFAQLKELEVEIQKMWVGREMSNRVRKASHQWSRSLGGTLRRFLS